MDDMEELGVPTVRTEVAAAVVTSGLGGLVGRRRNGNPLWTFLGGKIELGESPEVAAVQETLEEVGLAVRAAGIIGSRLHPVSAVPITYVAAVPVVADVAQIWHMRADSDGELTEVRWVGLEEALALMGDMAGPVRRYLQTALGN
jgi:8-oxo-dGTP diphosphatase